MDRRCERRRRRKKKPVGVYELLGFALGSVGLAYDDFCRLTPDEFRHVCKAYQDRREADYKDRWERMRMLAAIVVQPHVRKKLAPKDLLPFPWEKGPKRKAVSLREDKARLERLLKRKKKG